MDMMINITYAGKVSGRQYPVDNVFESLLNLDEKIDLNVYSNNIKWNNRANIKWGKLNFNANEYVSKDKLYSIYNNSSAFVVVVGNDCNCFDMIIPSKLSELSKFNKPILLFGPNNSQVNIIADKLNLVWFFNIQNPNLNGIKECLLQIKKSKDFIKSNNYKEVFKSRFSINSQYEKLIKNIFK
jgi:hypothetical protein